MLKTHCSVFLIFILLKCSAPKTVLDSALNDCNPAIKKVLKEKKYEIQILLSQIIRNPTGEISFEENSYQIDEDQYFYPASTVKLPIAILALQKLNTLKSKGIQINGNTPFYITSRKGDTIIKSDSTNKKGFVTVNHLIKKIFLVSDNDAYNYLFDFLGRDYINIELNKRNLKQSQIRHKFLFGADNINTWEYTFFDKNQNIVFHQPSLNSELNLKPHKLKGLFKGNAYKSSGNLLNEPMNFSKKNRISIRNLDGILKRIIFPEVFSKQERFNLTNEDYSFLRYWMSRNTLESTNPNYNNGKYWDSYSKFFIYGDQKGAMNREIRIYNKVGSAYGTLTDVAYIKDENNEVEFFLTATILVNENNVFNDDVYEFDRVGIPFLAALGRAVKKELEKE